MKEDASGDSGQLPKKDGSGLIFIPEVVIQWIEIFVCKQGG